MIESYWERLRATDTQSARGWEIEKDWERDRETDRELEDKRLRMIEREIVRESETSETKEEGNESGTYTASAH